MDEEPELRPLPPPPRCRGIPLGDGNYTGCAYGYGDLAPFTGPRDCPVCNGSGFEGRIETTLPHSDFGDPDCCGCLNGVIFAGIRLILSAMNAVPCSAPFPSQMLGRR